MGSSRPQDCRQARGTATSVMRKFAVLPHRFCEKVNALPSGCWEWQAATQFGYGCFSFEGKDRKAHRFAYERLVGPIPPQLQCDHLCRNRACVNPLHIELVTGKENIRRGICSNRLKTHCPQGHKYDRAWLAQGSWHRGCKTCKRVVDTRYRDERRLAHDVVEVTYAA